MAKAKKAATKVKEIKAKIDENLECTRIYSNIAEVTHSPFDMTIRFGDATPLWDDTEARKTGVHRIPLVVEIAIPIQMAMGLSDALKAQYEKYQENYGTPKDAKK